MQKWILGSEGIEKFSMLNKKLESQAFAKASTHLKGELTSYEPWMSSGEMRGHYSNLQGDCTSDKPGVTPTLSSLKNLSNTFSQSADTPDLFHILESDDRRAICTGPASKLKNFEERIDVLIDFINAFAPTTAKYFKECVHQVIPLSAKPGKKIRIHGSGFSTHYYRGGIFLSLSAQSATSLLEDLLNLVHEMGHQVLNIYLCSDFLISEKDLYKPIYSVIRKTERPALLSLQALMASSQMLSFINESQGELMKRFSQQVIETRKISIKQDIELGLTALKAISYTPLGKEIVEDMAYELEK